VQKLLVASIAGAAITTCNSLAFAADPGPRPIAKAPMTTVYDWTGLYVGGHVGWGSADRTFGQTNLSGNIVNPGFVQNPNGIIGGGQIGFNQQTGNFVWGLEIDISGASLRETTTAPVVFAPPLTETFNVSIDWTASLTARLGYAWDRWLVYGKGGAALMRETYA
jgi:outer membrane immunogenic protein